MSSVWQFGSHTSVAGGLHLGLESASKLGIVTCQIFTKNANQWNAKPLNADDIAKFQSARTTYCLGAVFSHASYLINMASPKDELRTKSVDSMFLELERANALGLNGVVVHPGAYVDSTEDEGISAFHRSLDQLLNTYQMKTAQVLIENTAGQGTTLGRSIQELAAMLKPFQNDPRIGICIDSCHAHAAGYDLSMPEGLDRLVEELEQYQLLKLVKAIHLNDSKKGAGSRVDRHEHIGVGSIGLDGISRFVHHEAFRNLPMILETEKGINPDGIDWDYINLQILHELVGQPYTATASDAR